MKSTVDLKQLLSKMTLTEKIGQLLQPHASLYLNSAAAATGPLKKIGFTDDQLKISGSTLNYHSLDDMIKIQTRHLEEDPNKIPMLFMMDVIHGYRTIFPIPLGMGASFDAELLKECTRMAAREASASGVNVTFTPMVDYPNDARWGRVMETCGEEPLINGIMGAAQVEAFQGDDLSDPDNIATCVKHFAAYGGAEAGRDYTTVEISERLLREVYLPAYKACIDAGTRMLMPSFNTLNGVPSTANKWLMNKVLRDEWGFSGIVISDFNAVSELIPHGIASNLKEAARMCFECGCDIEMVSTAYADHLRELVEEGVIAEEAIDNAAMKVLELKRDLGLFEDPYRDASHEKSERLCLSAEHRDIARRAAEAAAVLLKNDGVLPFSLDAKRIALIGPFAQNHGIKGFWACEGRDEDCVTVEEGVRALLKNAEIRVAQGCDNKFDSVSEEGFVEAIELAKWADTVILCLGEPQDYSGEANCRTDLTLPGPQDKLAKAVAEANANVAAIVFNGRPIVLTELSRTVPAILEMWHPGTEGGNAAANLLFGKANPSGKITMSFPYTTGQCPIHYTRTNTGRPQPQPETGKNRKMYHSNYIDSPVLPLYSFGHGLSYSNFVYESLELDTDTLTREGEIKVRVTVKNDSDVAGKEVVQLYMRDLVASSVRPIQKLIAFEKLEIGAGETRTVEFTVREEMLRFYDYECNYISEAGEFELSTGYADHLIFTKKFNLM